MTDEIAALRMELQRLTQENILTLHLMQQQLKRHDEELAALKAAMPKRVAFLEQFPDCETITDLQVQMFENSPRQGLSARVLKVYLWDTSKSEAEKERWQDGYYKPFVLPLQLPKNFRGNGSDTPIERCAESLREEPDWWLGCLEHKGIGKRIKGTQRLLCHGAILAPSLDLVLSIRGHEYDLGAGCPAKAGREDAPTRIWFWQA